MCRRVDRKHVIVEEVYNFLAWHCMGARSKPSVECRNHIAWKGEDIVQVPKHTPHHAGVGHDRGLIRLVAGRLDHSISMQAESATGIWRDPCK
jgi:hypothetical protein